MTSVTIICTNYNKGDAIAEAIESFLMQQTSFPVEILVIDDASTDGSQDIVRYYCEHYPDRITGVFQESNKGIAQTWRDSCKIALGNYIARCDGDDYWIDPLKLQKQVDLLESLPNCEWSNTDFDILLPGGAYIANAFAQNVVPFVDCFEDMLVKQAMTMASTWLVKADLMREVNERLPIHATDDTFYLQLELFKRTKLAYLPDSTTVFRLGEESDSRSEDIAKVKKRIDGIRDTQLEYIESEDWLDYKDLSKRFACWYAEHEAARMQQLMEGQMKIKELEGEIDRLRSSNSWKLTAPMRSVSDALKLQNEPKA